MRHYSNVHLVVPPGGSFRETRRIELGARVLTIGRGEGCDVRVDSPGVDDEHAKISEVALIAVGPDCAVGDVPLDAGSRRLVMPGDEIQIGAVVLTLEGSDPSLIPPPPEGGARPVGPRIRVVEGQAFGEELLLDEENREYVIGRSPKCDLILSEDREVSREHVKLVRRGWRVYLQDQSSTRGSWLGRAAVYSASTIEWQRPTMLKVGATVLSLELPEGMGRRAPPVAALSFTPPPRARSNNPTPSAPNAAPSEPPPASIPIDSGAASTKRAPPVVQYFDGSSTPAPPPTPTPPPHVYNAMPQPMQMPMQMPMQPHALPHTPHAPFVKPASNNTLNVNMHPQGHIPPHMLGTLPNASSSAGPRRGGWKKQGPTLGRASGLLLLALAGLAILGALFVVFSLME